MPTIDGGARIVTGSGTTASASLTTTSANDVIVAQTFAPTGQTVTGVAGGGLAWAKRGALTPTGGQALEEWYAIAASPLSAVSITVTFSGGGSHGLTLFGVSGANTTTPFDTNVSLPAATFVSFGSSASVSISTDNANDMLVAFAISSASTTFTPPAGFSTILADDIMRSASAEVVSATQSSAAIQYNIASAHALTLFVDAIQAASGGVSPSLTGLAATAALGSVVPSANLGMSPLQSTIAMGSATQADGKGMTGISAAAALGAPREEIDVPLGGISSAVNLGAFSFGNSASPSITGLVSALALGQVGPSIGVRHSGIAATASIGGISPTIAAQLAGIGVTAGPIGTLRVEIDVPLSGLVGVTSLGSVSLPGAANPAIAGLATAASLGLVKPSAGAGAGIASAVQFGSVPPGFVEQISSAALAAIVALGSVRLPSSLPLTSVIAKALARARFLTEGLSAARFNTRPSASSRRRPMRPNVFPLLDTVTLSVEFTLAADGTAVDPVAVNLFIKDPSGQQTLVAYPGDVVRDSAGLFHYDFTPGVPGVWFYKFQGTGGGVAATTKDATFQVQPSVMDLG